MPAASQLHVSFRAAPGGNSAHSIAVPVEGAGFLVAIVANGADPHQPQLLLGQKKILAKVVGFDPISRLQFLQMENETSLPLVAWLPGVNSHANAHLIAKTLTGPVPCRAMGWTKQVNGKVLPLALLKVAFDREVPLPGTPLVTNGGGIVAIIFQASDTGKIAYAIPAEAVHRVQRDICEGRPFVRGWLGLCLRAENKIPQIVRVLPDSPAAQAGTLPGDVLTSIGDRKISDYADAANAFFYLIPDAPVQVKLLRGTVSLEFTMTPSKPDGM